MRLVFRGVEISEYDYQYVDQPTKDQFIAKVGQRSAKKDIVKAEIKLIDYPGSFSEGYYSYPFQYQLPHNLPGTRCSVRRARMCAVLIFSSDTQACFTRSTKTQKLGVSGKE